MKYSLSPREIMRTEPEGFTRAHQTDGRTSRLLDQSGPRANSVKIYGEGTTHNIHPDVATTRLTQPRGPVNEN